MMQIWNAFLFGCKVGVRQWRITAVVYFFQVCLALTVGIQVYDVLESSIGNSLSVSKLLKHYDHTVLTDFLKVHGASITPLIGQMRWLLLVYLVFAVFIDAGLLFCATQPEVRRSSAFWQGGTLFFFKFLKIGVCFLVFFLLWTALVLSPIALFFEPSIQWFPSEKYSLGWAAFLLLIYVFGLIVLFIWAINSRLSSMQAGTNTAVSIRNGWRSFWQKKAASVGLVLLFLAIQGVLLGLYWCIEAFSGMVTPVLMVVVFAIQQFFAFLKIQIRQMVYAALGQLKLECALEI